MASKSKPTLQENIQEDTDSTKSWWSLRQAVAAAGLAALFNLIFGSGFTNFFYPLFLTLKNDIDKPIPSTGDDSNAPLVVTFLLSWTIASIVFYAILGRRARRRLKLEHWCQEHNWSFARKESQPLQAAGFKNPGDWESIRLLHYGSANCNFMWKKFDDRVVMINAFCVERHRGKFYKSEDSVPATRLIMETGMDAPEMQFKHHAITDHLNFGELNQVKFESDEFNKQWTVTSADPKRTYDVMDPSTMEFLLSLEGKYHFELNKGLLVIYSIESGFEQRLRLMKIAQDFSSAVPNDLIKPISIVG